MRIARNLLRFLNMAAFSVYFWQGDDFYPALQQVYGVWLVFIVCAVLGALLIIRATHLHGIANQL